MSLFNRSLFIISLLSILVLPGLSLADCSCQMGSNGIYYIGIEHIATECPPDPPSDDYYYHYIDYAVRCPGNTVLNWAFWGNTSTTPQSLANYYVNEGYRVLRNTSGTHIIGVGPNFQGVIAGVNFAGLAPGVYYGDLDEYCCHLPGNVYACSTSLPDDKDKDGWPVCFDCDDNNPEYTNNCPEIETPKNLGCQRCVTHSFAGNPINVGTGNKYHKEKDISSVPTPLGLEFTRHYNSQSEVSRSTGYGWSHTYDRHLSFEQGKIVAWREDGRAIFFSEDTLEPESGAKERLTLNPDNSYTLAGPDQIHETYDSSGNLINIYDLNGNTISLSYQDGKLAQVIGPFGRSMGFTYDDSEHISTVTDPAGNTIRYEYDSNDNLIRIIYPDTSTREYIYDDPNDNHNLTGIVDETGVRFATYAYDDKDRAILSTQAGNAGRIDVSYDMPIELAPHKLLDMR